MTNEKHFPKTISQWEFDYGLFTNLPRIIVTCDFSPRYPNLKTTCHIKLKFFLWTKLIENLLLPKYLISVTAHLMKIAEISSVFKKLDNTSIDNYRPISTLSNFTKLFESILFKQLSRYIQNRFSNHLTGFQKNSNTQNSLLSMIES